MSDIKIDFSEFTGKKIKALHGVNGGPLTKVFTYDARELFREAGFPYARLHDVEYPYGSGEFVDIPCVFKDFDSDENDPKSYNFALTDEYIKACLKVGAEPIFRLGVSIEHAPVKRYIYPPKDFMKWSRICEHIIRHYTEGWADGYHWDIRYWEIWNESDSCSWNGRNMWLGTPEEFYELYSVSATYLKKCFPHLMIGGCGYTRGYNKFIENFFEYITKKSERVPLDFYSWHRYFVDVEDVISESRRVDDLLSRYGYTETESIFDEWNYMRDWNDQSDSYHIIKNHIGAAFCGAVLCAMQTKTSIDVATYFEADVVKEWCGLFTVDKMSIGKTKASVAPLKPFYAFKAFNELYKLKNEVALDCEDQNIQVAAASNGARAAAMAVNYQGEDCNAELELSNLPLGKYDIRIVDESRTFETLQSFDAHDKVKLKLTMPKNSIICILKN